MKDINCLLCKQIIRYNDYKDQLRAVQFTGIVCPHCGENQRVRYTKVEGTGSKQVVQYEHRGKMMFPKRMEFTSCPYCWTFWSWDGRSNCPFCNSVLPEKGVEGRFVPKAARVPPGVGSMIKLNMLKDEYFGLQCKLNLAECYNVSDHFLGSLEQLYHVVQENENKQFKLKLEQQGKINLFSFLQTK